MTTVKNLDELNNILTDDLYHHVGLYGMDDGVYVPMNREKNYEENVRKIINYLSKENSPNGMYLIKTKVAYQGGKIDSYCFNKGNIAQNEIQPMKENNSLNIPTDFGAAIMHPAVKLQSEVVALQLENADLIRQIDELNEYIGELEEKISQQVLSEQPVPPSMFDQAQSFIGQLMQFGAPLLDKHFELKQQQIEVERAKINKGVENNVYQAPETKQELHIEKKIKSWIDSKSDNDELYNSLMAIYYNSSDIKKFAELLNNFNPELYVECKRQVER